MKSEYEIKILEINVEKIQKKLSDLNAERIGEKNMRRFVYDFNPIKENSWIRLRDTGKKITLTIKEIHSLEIDGTKELEIEVDDFETTNLILEKLGYKSKAYQENKRISYKLNDIEIEIDFWPQIPPYLEIEGKSTEEVLEMAKILGFTDKDITTIGTKQIYENFGIDIQNIKILKFEE